MLAEIRQRGAERPTVTLWSAPERKLRFRARVAGSEPGRTSTSVPEPGTRVLPMRIVGVLLAAGGGARFRASGAVAHKLTAILDGRPVHRYALDHLRDAAIGPIVVVTGAVPLELPSDVTEVHHERWADGQAGSLHAAFTAALALDPALDAVIVGLADQPGVPPEAWRAVAAAPAEWPIVVASYDGRRGPNPVRLLRSVWARVPVTGDEGARPVMRDHPDLVHEVPCPGTPHDIDTLEDLQRWKSS